MGFQLQTKDFIRYFQEAREVIAAQRDYVTELDSTTGDGDHWVNVNMGFEKITALSKELEDKKGRRFRGCRYSDLETGLAKRRDGL